MIQNITIGADPNAVALNPNTNKIYVASPETDIVYVIDGLTNNITSQIHAGPLLGDLAVDTDEFGGFSTLIFVTNQGNESVSIIDDVKGRVVSNIKTGYSPYGIGIDTIKNRAYITTNSGIDVIDYTTDLKDRSVTATDYGKVRVGIIPTGIVVDPETSKAYVTNWGDDTVSVIDTVRNEPLHEIKVGLFPNSIAFDPTNKMLYVANTGSNNVSLINSTSEKPKPDIAIDSIPYDVAVNPKTNMIYLANRESQTLATINGSVDKIVSALIFQVYPPNAGHIECNHPIPLNTYQRVIKNTKCEVIPNSGFVFSSWSDKPPSPNFSGIPDNKTAFDALSSIIFGGLSHSHEHSFNVSRYGIYTANFFSLPPIIQAASPYLSIGTLILVITLASIKPTFFRRRKTIEADKKSEEDLQAVTILAKVHKGDTLKKEKQGEKDKEADVVLSIGEILTIDATVIIGVLIFLTFSDGFEASEQYQINIITASIVFPFAISAIIGVTRNEKFATRLMIAGFINLMISVILIAIMKL